MKPKLTELSVINHDPTKSNRKSSNDLESFQQLVMEALKYHLLPERRPMLQSNRTRPRKATVGQLIAIGGMDANKGIDTTIDVLSLRESP